MWDGRRIATATALAATAGVVWLLASKLDSPPAARPPVEQATQRPVGPDARAGVSVSPELPGRADIEIPPGLDFGQPDEVARAYLEAAHSLRDVDTGRTNRRVMPYLSPDNPANPRGLVVVDAPAAGRTTAQVVDLRRVQADRSGRMVAYQARWSVLAGPSESSVEHRTSFVVLIRQPDGRWLVRQEATSLHPGD